MGLVRIHRAGDCFVVHPDFGHEVLARDYFAAMAARQHNQSARSHLAAPAVQSDFRDPVRCMLDGKMYDSRRHYRDVVRDHGCEILGNDTIKPERTKLPDARADLADVLYGRRPLDEQPLDHVNDPLPLD